MKKVIFSVLLCTVYLNLFSQEKNDRGFCIAMNWGFGHNTTSINNYSVFHANIDAGYRFNNLITCRLGTGIIKSIKNDVEASFVPITTIVETIPVKKKFSPYISLKEGIVIDADQNHGACAAMIEPQIGLAINTFDQSILILYVGIDRQFYNDDKKEINHGNDHSMIKFGIKGVIWN